MVTHRLVILAIAVASLGTACTAIVLGKIGETGDYKTVPTLGSSSGSPLDRCSLLKGETFSASSDHDANACATCIETRCKDDVAYACNNSSGTKAKPWFDDLKKCAQNPWNGLAPPAESSGGSSNTSYGCKSYETPATPISDNGSDTEREPKSHNCVNTNCLQGGTPACKMCEVHIRKSQADPTEALLRNDPCGKCFVDKCPETLVKCCDTGGMYDFVDRCAFTADPANKAACRELGNPGKPDAGDRSNTFYNDAGVQCLNDLKRCFQTYCATNAACQ